MSIRAFKTFLAVAKHGTFAAAANQVGLTQPAVSLQMKAFEEELNAHLFDRSGRSVVLNTAARRLIPRATELVELYDGVVLSANAETLGGSLSIGAIPTTFAKLLPDAVLLLRHRHPRIEVQVANGRSEELLAKVERGELDVALVSNPPRKLPKTILSHPIVQEPLVMITPKSVNVKSAKDVFSQHPFIRNTRNTWTGSLVDQLLKRGGVTTKDIMELDSIDVIAEMVSRGLGISIIPLGDGTWQKNQGLRLLRIVKPKVYRVGVLIQRRSHSRSQLTGAFRQCLLDRRTNDPDRAKLQEISIA